MPVYFVQLQLKNGNKPIHFETLTLVSGWLYADEKEEMNAIYTGLNSERHTANNTPAQNNHLTEEFKMQTQIYAC